VAIITGAGRGIGRALSSRLAKDGATLSLISRTRNELEDAAKALRKSGTSVLARSGDVSNADDVRTLVEETLGHLGRVDVLVNNASILGPVGPMEESDCDAWIRTVKVNLIGVFLCCKYVIPWMKKQKSGKIINISGAGAPMPYPWFSAYSASKTGVLGLTQTLAEEVKEYNIQVNAVAPGIANTRMQDEILSAGALAGEAFLQAKEVKEKGGVDLAKVSELVAFLASEDSDGITGKFFSARWDDWQSLEDRSRLEGLVGSEMYTVRRIDGVFFGRLRGSKRP